jgi:site-specific DNA recombinase
MDGYIRLSRRMKREGPGYISPDIQREAVQRWADYRGVEIVKWHTDEDESGGTQDRPGLRECMERIEAGDTDGIACWRLNRFARNVGGAIGDVERVQAAGGVLALVEEDIDPTGPFGSLILTVLLAVATLERDNVVAGWKTAKARATEHGAKIGPTPFGYVRVDTDYGVLQPDPVLGPVVTHAFEVAATQGLNTTLVYLIEHGTGRTWTTSTVRRFLANRAYLGESRYGDLINLHAHAPLVTRATFEAAQPQLSTRRRPKGTFPMSGLARCASCESPMVGARGGADGRRTYRCSAALSTHKGPRCTNPSTASAELLEEVTRTALLASLSDHPEVAAADSVDLDAVEDALRDAERVEIEYATDVELQRILGLAAWRAGAEKRALDVEQAQRDFREAAAQSARQPVILAPDVLRDAGLEDLGQLLRGALDAVVVTRGRSPLAGRVRFIAK